MVVRSSREGLPPVDVPTDRKAMFLRPRSQDPSIYAFDEVLEVAADASVQQSVYPFEHGEDEQQLLEYVSGEVPARGEERMRSGVDDALLAQVVHEPIDVATPFLDRDMVIGSDVPGEDVDRAVFVRENRGYFLRQKDPGTIRNR
jgi:hypothetical protein